MDGYAGGILEAAAKKALHRKRKGKIEDPPSPTVRRDQFKPLPSRDGRSRRRRESQLKRNHAREEKLKSIRNDDDDDSFIGDISDCSDYPPNTPPGAGGSDNNNGGDGRAFGGTTI